ncbi:neuronal acetylcholine receptor subunit alpha-7 [Plakobranchus ocellatus]|uniref:Neuronal acetylcholine receptor subunit alpha-7 n=1 Tax=Plakobranchus ocellatus TaxID=259542 RepID=A0AAV3YG01_9GAST|nr:neuronal acetylcholine receptor subunit alpha-7 [Plakobranchus ocellatus]
MAKRPRQNLTRFPRISAQIVLIVLVSHVHGDFNKTAELYSKLFSSINNQIHPSLNTSVPTEVFVQLNLRSLREIVEREQYFVISAWMEVTWKDEIRSWDPSQYDGVSMVYPGTQEMWKPQIIVSNSIGERDLQEYDHSPLTLSWDGSAQWLPGAMFSLSCTMDMTYFPFDRQTCELSVFAKEYVTDVTFTPTQPTVNTLGYAKDGEWHLESTSVTSRTVAHKKFQFSRLTYTFNFSRRAAFYLYNVLMPVVLMSLLSPLVFLLPEDSGERVSYAVTLLLSLAVFMGFVASLLPHSSEPLSLCIVYMFVMLIHNGLCVVCSVVHLRWEKYKRDRSHTSCENQELQNQTRQHAQQSDQHHQQPTLMSCSYSNNFTTGKTFLNNCKTNASSQDTKRKVDIHHENIAMANQLQMDGIGNSRFSGYKLFLPFQFSCESLWSANNILFVIFYCSWFMISVYFLVQII